jgi:type III pantothenate kinase
MLLAIDSGNTNIVFAIFDENGEIRGKWRVSTNVNRTADELGVWLMQLMSIEGLDRSRVDGAAIATVVPDTMFALKALCRKYFNVEPVIVGEAGVRLMVENMTDRPEEVGADRLVNAVAAHAVHGGPLIVVDFGTATTFDVVDQEGRYYGGVIAPGINLSLEALHMAAAKLPRVAIRKPDKVIGTNTVTAMQSGIFWGYVALIEGMVARIRAEFGAAMKVIATGGLAPLFAESTSVIESVDGDLTLRGLLLVHQCNRGK